MVLEIAEFTAISGKADEFAIGIQQGIAVIRTAEGCIEAQVSRAVEDDHQFVLLVRWRRIEDHLDTFRNGPLFGTYRQHINGFFAEQPRVRHYPIDD